MLVCEYFAYRVIYCFNFQSQTLLIAWSETREDNCCRLTNYNYSDLAESFELRCKSHCSFIARSKFPAPIGLKQCLTHSMLFFDSSSFPRVYQRWLIALSQYAGVSISFRHSSLAFHRLGHLQIHRNHIWLIYYITSIQKVRFHQLVRWELHRCNPMKGKIIQIVYKSIQIALKYDFGFHVRFWLQYCYKTQYVLIIWPMLSSFYILLYLVAAYHQVCLPQCGCFRPSY